MTTFCSQLKELIRLKDICKERALLTCKDKWRLRFYNKLEEFKESIERGDEQNFICYELTDNESISYAKYIRKCYSYAMMILMANQKISPMEYIRPDIMPAGLMVMPITDEDMDRVIRDVFESYFQKMKEDSVGEFRVVRKDGISKIPYNDILYFEARDKRVYVRYRNEEIGFNDSLDTVKEELPDEFVRVHRSIIINKRMIREVVLAKNIVRLKSHLEVPFSRRYKDMLRSIAKEMGGNGCE